jgi:hypothetical protein
MRSFLRLLAIFVAAMNLTGCLDLRSAHSDGGRYYRIQIDKPLVDVMRTASQGLDAEVLTGNNSIDVNGTTRATDEHATSLTHVGGGGGGGGGSGFSRGGGNFNMDGGGAAVVIVIIVIVVVVVVILVGGYIYHHCSHRSMFYSSHYVLDLRAGELPSQSLSFRNGKHIWLNPEQSQAISTGVYRVIYLRHGDEVLPMPVSLTMDADTIYVHLRPSGQGQSPTVVQ